MDKNIFVMLFLLNMSTSVYISVEKYHELRHQISKWTVCSKIYVHNYALITSIISIHVQERCGIKIRNKVSFHRSEFHFCSSLQLYIFLTKHFAILEPQNPEMDAFYVVQKRHYKDFEALQLRNVRSGLKAEREEEKKAPTYIYYKYVVNLRTSAPTHIFNNGLSRSQACFIIIMWKASVPQKYSPELSGSQAAWLAGWLAGCGWLADSITWRRISSGGKEMKKFFFSSRVSFLSPARPSYQVIPRPVVSEPIWLLWSYTITGWTA